MTAKAERVRYYSGGHRKPYCPAPEQLLELRKAADLDMGEAAALVHYSAQAWSQWETQGTRAMHPALWELFQIKARRLIKQKEVQAKRARLDLVPAVV